MICITTIIGYFLKYLLNLFIFDEIEVREINDIKKTQRIINEGNDDINCSLNYECFEQFFNNTNLTVSNGPLFNSLVNWFIYNDKLSMYSILIIYSSSVILSIILYSIFMCIFTKNEKEKNENGNSYRVCQIYGYTIYSENIVLNLNPPCCECCKLLCITCSDCLTMTCCSLCCCISEEEKNDFGTCFCCCECCKKNDNTYKKNTEFFCYCYQAKRKQNWFNKFITSEIQRTIFPYMLEYFVLQFFTIAFEKQYYDIPITEFKPNYNETQYNQTYSIDTGLKKEDWFNFINFIVTFFLFFYVTLTTNFIFKITRESDSTNKTVKAVQNQFSMINKLSTGILDGTHGLLIFDGVYSFILSVIYLANNDASIFQYHYFIFSPILMNKFYYFTLIYFCISFSESKKKFELISGSTLISIYLLIWSFIISLIRDSSSLKKLYITQIVFASIPSLFVAISIISFIVGILCMFYKFECLDGCMILGCFCSFLVCFGGFWFDRIVFNDDNNNECDCDCCECYDCLGCCDCCGHSCSCCCC